MNTIKCENCGHILVQTKSGMTPKQVELLDFLRNYKTAKGYAPSYAEMQAHMHLKSKSGISRLVKGLAARGHIAYSPAMRRSVMLLGALP